MNLRNIWKVLLEEKFSILQGICIAKKVFDKISEIGKDIYLLGVENIGTLNRERIINIGKISEKIMEVYTKYGNRYYNGCCRF